MGAAESPTEDTGSELTWLSDKARGSVVSATLVS